ncbi:MAG: TetR/AcrR family transcriptional regulator [Steroidobacteraceae bacterium]
MRFRTARVSRTRHEGTKQADKILRAARSLFIRQGPGGFSARQVAKEAGLSLGSVQHVFPTIDSLLVAMLEYVISRYDAEYESMVRELPFNPTARLSAILDFLIDDIFEQDTRRFFYGFWVLSCHNPLAGVLLKEAYSHHVKNLAPFIAAVRPDCAETTCLSIARQVAALIEGWMVFTATGLGAAGKTALRETLRNGVDTLVRESRGTAPTAKVKPERGRRSGPTSVRAPP